MRVRKRYENPRRDDDLALRLALALLACLVFQALFLGAARC